MNEKSSKINDFAPPLDPSGDWLPHRDGGGGSEDEPSSRFQLLARAAPRPVAVGGAVVSVVVSEELSGCGERRLRGEATAPPPLPDRRGSKGCITYASWLAVLPG